MPVGSMKSRRVSSESVHLVTTTVMGLVDWLIANGWTGYDPYDALAFFPFLPIESLRMRYYSKLRKLLYPISLLPSVFPKATRIALQVKKSANAKAAGVLVKAYLNLFEVTGDKSYLTESNSLLQWLVRNPSRGYGHLCWGYPFHWQTPALFVEAGTPSAVVTSQVTQALSRGYELTGEQWMLKAAADSCRFFTKRLNIYEDHRGICFSYTPLDTYRVHNANVMTAFTLAMFENIAGTNIYDDLIRKAVDFTISDQTEEGAFFYYDRAYSESCGLAVGNHVDNLHTGYVIEYLAGLNTLLDENKRIADAVRKSIPFYRRRMISRGCVPVPRLGVGRFFPVVVDIHDCAETIIVFSRLYRSRFIPSLDPAVHTAEWTIRNLHDTSGYFYNAIFLWGKGRFPYLRWGQAWMLYALSELLKAMAQPRDHISKLGSN
jgi:hypothetical protein